MSFISKQAFCVPKAMCPNSQCNKRLEECLGTCAVVIVPDPNAHLSDASRIGTGIGEICGVGFFSALDAVHATLQR